jgi:hypothetical protein
MLRIGLERQHQARHAGVIERSADPVLAAFAVDLLDAPTTASPIPREAPVTGTTLPARSGKLEEVGLM